MARLFLQVILLVAFVAVLDCAPASPPLSDPVPPKTQDTPQPKAHDGTATPSKPRTARAAQQNTPGQQNAPAQPNPLLTVPEARVNEPTTTVRARPARAAEHEGKPHEDSPVIHGTQLDGNERSNDGHSTTPKSRPARAADHEGKPHEDNPVIHGTQLDGNERSNEGHSTTPKSRPARAADHEGKPHDEGSSLSGKAAENHDDHSHTSADHDGKQHDDHHEDHSATPKSRPARASGVPEKSDDTQEHPAQAVPLAKLGNTEQNPTPKSRPARATPNEDSRASHAGAQPHVHDDVKQGTDKKEDDKSNEHRHRRDTEGPQDISKALTHILVRGEPVPINLDEKAEEKIKENQPERQTRDTEVKKNEGGVGTAQTLPAHGAHARPATRPSATHHDRHRRDDGKAAARQPEAPLKASQPDSHSGPAVPLIGLAKPENTARHTRDTGSSTLPPFKGIHGPTQGDLENIRKAKEEREKLGQQ